MPKALKIILILIFFIAFFEAGLFSSYTIITSEAPDVQGLIDLQVNTITGFFNSDKINEAIIKDPTNLNVSNKVEVADAMADAAKVDGIDVRTMNVTTRNSTEDSPFEVEISALAYSSPNSTKGSLTLSGTPDYSVTVTAMAENTDDGIEVNTTSIKVVSIMKLVNQDSSFVNNADFTNASSSDGSGRMNITFG